MTVVAITSPDLVTEINKLLGQGMYAIIRERSVQVELITGTEVGDASVAVLLEYQSGNVKGATSFTVNKTFSALEGIKANFPLLFSIQGQYWIVTADAAEPSKHKAHAITSYKGLFTETKFKRDVISIIEEPVSLKVVNPITVVSPTETK